LCLCGRIVARVVLEHRVVSAMRTNSCRNTRSPQGWQRQQRGGWPCGRRCLIAMVAVLCVAGSAAAQEAQERFAIAIHGGAGRAPASEAGRTARIEVLEQALSTGERMLREGRSSLDTVEAVVRILEDSESFNAGKGAVFNAAGGHELDATIMDGRDRSTGAVGGVTTVKNPISLARRVMTDTRHVLLVSAGADRFAD